MSNKTSVIAQYSLEDKCGSMDWEFFGTISIVFVETIYLESSNFIQVKVTTSLLLCNVIKELLLFLIT